MAKDQNVYHVTMSDGTAYTVTTDKYHDDHARQVFLQHLLDVIKSSASQIVSGVVVEYVHKGRK